MSPPPIKDRTSEKFLHEMKISDLPDKESKLMVIKITDNLRKSRYKHVST